MYTEIIIRLDGIRPKLADAICQSVKSMSPSVDIIDVILHTKPADGNDDQMEDEDDQTESAGQTENESRTESDDQTENESQTESDDQTESEDYHWYLD